MVRTCEQQVPLPVAALQLSSPFIEQSRKALGIQYADDDIKGNHRQKFPLP